MFKAYLGWQRKSRKSPLNERVKKNRKSSCEYIRKMRKRLKISLVTSERGYKMSNDASLREWSLFKTQLVEK